RRQRFDLRRRRRSTRPAPGGRPHAARSPPPRASRRQRRSASPPHRLRRKPERSPGPSRSRRRSRTRRGRRSRKSDSFVVLLNVAQLVRDHSTPAVLMRCSEFATQSTAVPAAMGMSAQGRTGGTPLSRLEWTNARGMDNLAEIREFLMSRHAKTTPAQAGIAPGPNRRVAGLRRTEVALLAGVSAEYCAELERGAIAGASASVLDALAQALQLNDTAHANLLDLARAADGTPILGRSPTERCSEARLQ